MVCNTIVFTMPVEYIQHRGKTLKFKQGFCEISLFSPSLKLLDRPRVKALGNEQTKLCRYLEVCMTSHGQTWLKLLVSRQAK